MSVPIPECRLGPFVHLRPDITGVARALDTERARLVVVSLGAVLPSFDASAVTVALPDIGAAFGLDLVRTLWVQAAFLVAVAASLLPLGYVADRRGRLAPYCAGLGLSACGALAAAFAPSFTALLLARAVQGIGAALIVATSAALASQVVQPSHRGAALGLNTMCVYLGMTAGAPIAGLLLGPGSWRLVFLASGGLSVAFIAPALKLSTTDWGHRLRVARPRKPVSPFALLLLAAGLTGILVGITLGPVRGWSSPWTVLLTAGGCATTGLAFLLARRTLKADGGAVVWLDARLFAVACTAAFLTYVAVHAVASLTSLLLQTIEQLSSWQAGLILLVQPATMVAVAPWAGRLYDRFGSRRLTTTGQLLMCGGCAFLATTADACSWVAVLSGLVVLGAGLALFSTPNISAVLGSVPPERLSSAASFLGMLRMSGQAVSFGLLGAIAAAAVGGAVMETFGNGEATQAFLTGYQRALGTAAVVSLLGALTSALRGPETVRGQRAPDTG